MYVEIFCLRKIFRTQPFAGFEVIFCLKLLFRKCVTYVAGCSFAKTCSLTGCSSQWNSIYQLKWFNNSMFNSMFDELKK